MSCDPAVHASCWMGAKQGCGTGQQHLGHKTQSSEVKYRCLAWRSFENLFPTLLFWHYMQATKHFPSSPSKLQIYRKRPKDPTVKYDRKSTGEIKGILRIMVFEHPLFVIPTWVSSITVLETVQIKHSFYYTHLVYCC